MKSRKLSIPGLVALAVTATLLAAWSAPSAQAEGAAGRATTGVGSCTLKNWNPASDPDDAKDLPQGQRPQSYRPDDYNCAGATFAANGAEFTTFPQPKNFAGGRLKSAAAASAQASSSPLSPYFPPFTHFVILYRENHTFDDYLGDCATTVQAGCNGTVQSTNHISSVPNLHALAKTYSLADAYSTGTQPPSGPNHWWLFSAQSASSSQQQSYPSAGGTQFDRFLKGVSGPSGEGTDPCAAQVGAASGTSPYTFLMNGDFYWMLSTGSGEWRNPGTGKPEVLPVNRPGTSTPEELSYNNYTCKGQNDDDQTIGTGFLNFVAAHGLPAYSYVELFNDHPGTYQDIPKNDAVTKQIVDSIMGNAAYTDNTLIVVTEDDTQNGNNGPDHVSNTYRVPLVVVASPLYAKQHYLSHVAYTTNNVLAAMERTMENVHPGIIDPNNNLGLGTYPMTAADQSALGDPLEDFWIQGATPLSATGTGSPTAGNAPLGVSFTGSATGGTAPYTFGWNFGDGTAGSTAQSPSHTYNVACTCSATLTVTDSASPPRTSTSTVTVKVSAVGNPLSAAASAAPTSGQVPLNVSFTGVGTGGTPPYTYSWNFGDGSANSAAQNPGHTYTAAGTYSATLTITDGASPVHSASSSVTLTASPIAGTPPEAPTGLSATPGSGQATLTWAPPTNNGGVAVTSYRVYRGTSPGTETLLTTGGCSSLGVTLSCTDTGLTDGQTYYYKVSAVNAIGEGAQSTEANVKPSSSCSAQQLLVNGGFETGSAAPWSATSGVVSNNTSEAARTGSWKAWLDGYGSAHTDTLSQKVVLPTGCGNYQFTFWMHVDTAETTTTDKYDTLTLQVLNSSGAVVATPYTYSNLNKNIGYGQHTFNLAAYAGQTITLKFTGTEDYTKQTSFVIDDAAVNVS